MDNKHIKLGIITLLALAVVLKLIGAIIFAIVLAYLSKPFFGFLQKRIKSRGIASGITTLLTLVLIIYPIIILVKSLTGNISGIVTFTSDIVRQITSLASSNVMSSSVSITEFFVEKIINSIAGFLSAIPLFLLTLFIMLSMQFYFLRDGDKIKSYIYSLASDKKEANMVKEIENLLKDVIIGNFASAIIIGLIAFALFTLMGVEFASILGIFTGLAAIVPIIGVWIVYIPLIVYYFLIGNTYFGIVMVGIGIALQILEMYLGPKISSNLSKIHPAIMLLGFIGGPLFFGIKGIVLGPIILGALKIALDNYRK